MMKRILKTTAALIALGLSGTAMAAGDGLLGSSSNQSMNVTVNVAADTSNYVQILGLEDVTFNGLVASPNGIPGFFENNFQHFCLNKNTPGNVTLAIDKAEIESPAFLDQNYYTNELVNGNNRVTVGLELARPSGDTLTTDGNNSWPSVAASSPQACTASSGAGIAFTLQTTITTAGQADLALYEGQYTNTFTLTLTPG